MSPPKSHSDQGPSFAPKPEAGATLQISRGVTFDYYYGMEHMISRHRFKQSESLKDRFISKVRRVCEEAKMLSRREEDETKQRHQRNDQK